MSITRRLAIFTALSLFVIALFLSGRVFKLVAGRATIVGFLCPDHDGVVRWAILKTSMGGHILRKGAEMAKKPVSERFELGMTERRRVLGDAYVDQAEANKVDFDAPYQEMITEAAWGHVWSRDDVSSRDRSMIVLGILAALGRWEEFELHIRTTANTGATPEDIREVLLHIAIYAGVPAANSAFGIAKRTLKEMGKI